MENSVYSAIQYNDQVANKILNICQNPLFDRFKEYGLSSFGYVKLFQDGKWLCVSNNKEWVTHFFSIAHLSTEFQKCILEEINEEREYLSYCNEASDLKVPIYSAAYDKGVWNGFNIYNRNNKNYIEYCYFHGTRESQGLVNFYINNINILKHFFLYFKEKAKDIIDTRDEKKLVFLRESILGKDKKSQLHEMRESFFQETHIERTFLNGARGAVRLSKRESQCLDYLKSGRTVKQIGQLLNLSPRTVEQYIQNIKDKTGAHYIREIITL